MASPLYIPVVQYMEFRPGDRLEVEVDGVILPDRLALASFTRDREGYGYDTAQATGYGFGDGLPYGSGVYGEGYYGLGADVLTVQTATRFVAGDYTVRLRAVDNLGNAGDWTDALTHEHRPQPTAPAWSATVNGVLHWTWSDP